MTFQCKNQTSTKLGDYNSSYFLQLKFLKEGKTYLQYKIQKIPIDLVEQLKLAHKVVDVIDRANRNFCLTFVVVKGGGVGEFICSKPNLCGDKEGREFSKNCLCEF